MRLTVLSFDQNYLKWVKPFRFFIKNCLQYRKKTTQIKPYNCSLKKDQMSFQSEYKSNRVVLKKTQIILNPFFIRMIKNLVKDDMRVFWSKMIKNIKKNKSDQI